MGPPRTIGILKHVFDFSGLWKNCLRWPQIRPGGFVPTNPDLADILGGTDLDFENFYFIFDFLDHKFLDFQVPRSRNSQIYRSPGLQISRYANSQISRFPDF